MDNNRPNKLQIIGGAIVSTILFGFCFWLSFLLTNLIFSYTGTPPKAFTYILTGLLGIYIFAAGVRIIIDLHGDKHNHLNRNQVMEETFEAMKRIAQGDFSVVLNVEKHDPFSQLAENINKMAQELGTMENLRQDFISNVSHEIQSPLTSISGFAELLRNPSITAEDSSHYLDIIQSESKRLSQLSDNLLKLSALEEEVVPLSLTKYRLDKQIQDALLILEPQWSNKNLDISLNLEDITITGDENLMAQVWINLLHNAIKFTPDGGLIDITLKNKDSEIICRIEDSGIGISEEDKLHIFERFYKVDKARDRNLGGNGLGLSLVKKIVELHKGSIQVESEVGTGTIFHIKLPR